MTDQSSCSRFYVNQLRTSYLRALLLARARASRSETWEVFAFLLAGGFPVVLRGFFAAVVLAVLLAETFLLVLFDDLVLFCLETVLELLVEPFFVAAFFVELALVAFGPDFFAVVFARLAGCFLVVVFFFVEAFLLLILGFALLVLADPAVLAVLAEVLAALVIFATFLEEAALPVVERLRFLVAVAAAAFLSLVVLARVDWRAGAAFALCCDELFPREAFFWDGFVLATDFFGCLAAFPFVTFLVVDAFFAGALGAFFARAGGADAARVELRVLLRDAACASFFPAGSFLPFEAVVPVFFTALVAAFLPLFRLLREAVTTSAVDTSSSNDKERTAEGGAGGTRAANAAASSEFECGSNPLKKVSAGFLEKCAGGRMY
mmetsp:Transcript_35660/g.69986  ORF Transcript_35660/g.69986 Transcript_35660/m.69986 type:complete len:378 (+) Transcript_35660:138-1271(+)|eukprot:CAMPEP_0175139450 /NCGR_PEP_ID=MMETSP0087-20121206/10909_1 /TAXON_ID=136419 /ORGANISM="Unknown Unknown, Strain D1" /LENGTH=377 /DNA_ID=CAMNT_0016422461 /DNA_START=138 /DNA_END=1271 /DNA_ORIENTATION=-